MSKSARKTQLDMRLRRELREYHAMSGITQEALAEKLDITPRACSALENGASGFSAFSLIQLFALLPVPKRILLLTELCEIVTASSHGAA